MMTTLPRLYGITKNGKCFIKPSMRGLFNTTMKYIFGKDYEEQGIEIFCTALSHDVTLVIRSDKILNKTIKSYTDIYKNSKEIKILEKQFNIKNRDFFREHSIGELNEEGKNLYQKYENCISANENECENEWDIFTQYYWPNMYSNEYVDIPGFEKYQITIDSDMVFQPSFITPDNELMSGTNYIVSGSFEDKWGIGLFAIGHSIIN